MPTDLRLSARQIGSAAKVRTNELPRRGRLAPARPAGVPVTVTQARGAHCQTERPRQRAAIFVK